jgi:hypothetical protein
MNLFCTFGKGEQFTRVVLAYASNLGHRSLERTHGIIFVAGRRNSMSRDKVTSVRWSPPRAAQLRRLTPCRPSNSYYSPTKTSFTSRTMTSVSVIFQTVGHQRPRNKCLQQETTSLESEQSGT